jgi:hypothetical protein
MHHTSFQLSGVASSVLDDAKRPRMASQSMTRPSSGSEPWAGWSQSASFGGQAFGVESRARGSELAPVAALSAALGNPARDELSANLPLSE